jgi:outer membrane protein TolC
MNLNKKDMLNWNMRKTNLMKYRLVFLFIILINIKLSAQDTITVEQAVATALQNAYDIQLSRNDSLIAAIDYSYRNAAFLPQLNASSTTVFNNNNRKETLANGNKRTGNGIKTNNTSAALNLNWVVFDGFKMFTTRTRLAQQVELGSLTIKNQVVNTIADVITTYYDIVQQKQQLKNIDEQMVLSADRLKLATYNFELGAGIRPDVLQAQIDLNQQKAARLNALTVIDQRKQELNRLMNVSQNINYEVSDTIPVRMDLALGDLLVNINEASPELLVAQKNIEVSRTFVQEAKADRFPRLTLNSAYNFSRNQNNTVLNPAQSLVIMNHGFNYGFTVSVPIFNNFSVRRNIQQAELAVRYQQLLYSNQQSIVGTSMLNTYKNYDAQKQILVISDSSIALARENLMIERERYRLGVTTFIELRQAEQNVASAITTLITARYNLKLAETELLRLRGDLVK